jgi:hypothetical protein
MEKEKEINNLVEQIEKLWFEKITVPRRRVILSMYCPFRKELVVIDTDNMSVDDQQTLDYRIKQLGNEEE